MRVKGTVPSSFLRGERSIAFSSLPAYIYCLPAGVSIALLSRGRVSTSGSSAYFWLVCTRSNALSYVQRILCLSSLPPARHATRVAGRVGSVGVSLRSRAFSLRKRQGVS